MQDVRDLREDDDVPLFLHVPKASGTTAKEILLDCYGLIRTKVIQLPSSLEVITEGGGVLDVDLSAPDAIGIARRNGMADRGLADVFVSQLGLEGITIFTPRHAGAGRLRYSDIR